MSDEKRARAASIAEAVAPELVGAVILLATDGTIVHWNDAAVTLFGFTSDEVLGRSILETIVPAELADEKRRWLRSALSGDTPMYESMRVRKDGVRIWVDIVVKVITDETGERLLLLNERDISRIKYQRDAQVLQTRFGDVLEAAPDAIVIVDPSGRIALINSETERLFGYGREELLGQMVEQLIPGRFHPNHPAHRSGYFHGPRTRPMGAGLELSGRRKDGTEFQVEISLSPISIEKSVLAMAAIRDVSDRTRTEEALKAANRELESFTYSVSHDLRAPIRQIDGFSRILAEHLGAEIDEKSTHYLKRIREGAENMGRLVDDLLHLAQVGRQDVKPAAIALRAVVDEVIADLGSQHAARSIEWRVGGLPTTVCDPGLMKIVFTNLLQNAVKYTRPRPVAVIEIGEALSRGRRAVFVRDNGVGFDMKYVDKLFGVFQRLHRVEEFEGTGVGLATVQRIIHKHDGQIWAEAELDGGATFFFALAAGVGA